ncbi:MAG TPA: M23 family metallopeptidase [Kofleriaceae bacterium]|nr:M23 family metallopeptidase [Kofleriaceae bacterium]
MTARGHVALWHPDCWELRDVPLPVAAADTAPVAPVVRSGRRFEVLRSWRAAVLGATAVALVAGGVWTSREDVAAAVPASALVARESVAVRSAMPAREDPPPRRDRTVRPIGEADEIPLEDGKPLDELFPTLKNWIHPVTASGEYMPTFGPRLFGSERYGVGRLECGAGHCGVDLDGPRGRPIVSVAAGIVIHVDRRELGGDRRSGRYVRIQHEDGTFTSYMHMDDVAEGLTPGTAVTRGQYVGTLGATAVYVAPPHLHFSLEIPAVGARDIRGDHIATRYVNPAPFLVRSTIVPVIERPSRPALN